MNCKNIFLNFHNGWRQHVWGYSHFRLLLLKTFFTSLVFNIDVVCFHFTIYSGLETEYTTRGCMECRFCRTKQLCYWILHIYLVEKQFSTFFIKQPIYSSLFPCKKKKKTTKSTYNFFNLSIRAKKFSFYTDINKDKYCWNFATEL